MDTPSICENMKITKDDVIRYDSMLPKEGVYTSLEEFLRKAEDDYLVTLREYWTDERNINPAQEFYLFLLMGTLFINEYGVEEMTKKDYVELLPVFISSISHEIICRYQPSLREDYWRDFNNSSMKYYEEVVKE